MLKHLKIFEYNIMKIINFYRENNKGLSIYVDFSRLYEQPDKVSGFATTWAKEERRFHGFINFCCDNSMNYKKKEQIKS